ncbi:hypothetical protein ASE14_06460 [Agromyces sp. Root81]|nr:hypothetical protein ASE14_06460 [Agromyces sp. Root81]
MYERKQALTDWVDTMRDLGVDADRELETELAALNRSSVLAKHAGKLAARRLDNAAEHTAAALTLAQTDRGYEDAVALAIDAATDLTEQQLHKSLDILSHASEQAVTIAWNRFKNRGDTALDLIRPHYIEHAEAAIRVWESLPDGITNREHAVRFRRAADWDELEDRMTRVRNAQTMVFAWLVDDIINTNGVNTAKGRNKLEHYNLDMFFYEDRAAARDAKAGRGGTAAEVRAIAAGRPALNTITTVDATTFNIAPHEDPTHDPALRQRQADAEALKDLERSNPGPHKLGRTRIRG